MAIRIAKDRVVRLAYRLTDSNGNLIEDRTPGRPFEYLHGRGQIVPAIEKTLEGKTAGFRAELQLSAREGYGDYEPSLVTEVSRAGLPNGAGVRAGMKFNTTGPGGQPLVVRVIEANEQTVTLDGNHPLAGVELIFELRVLDVREASAAEVASGQVAEDGDGGGEIGGGDISEGGGTGGGIRGGSGSKRLH